MNNPELYEKLLGCGCTKVWLPEMEFLPQDKMDYRKQLRNDVLDLDDLTVFAVDGYGNLFAWRDDDSVVFVDVGSGMCEEFSANLADAVFRRIVEFANGDYAEMCTDEEKAEMDPDDAEYCISESDAVELLKQYVSTFGNFFGEEQRNYIGSLIEHGFLPDASAFITEEELMRVLREQIKVNKSESKSLNR